MAGEAVVRGVRGAGLAAAPAAAACAGGVWTLLPLPSCSVSVSMARNCLPPPTTVSA
jgi:hypothetical protein